MLTQSLLVFTSFAKDTIDSIDYNSFCFFIWGNIICLDMKYQMIWIVLSDTRFHVVFHAIYLGFRKLRRTELSLVAFSNFPSLDMLNHAVP